MKYRYIITILALLLVVPTIGESTAPPRGEVVIYQPEFIGGDLQLLPVSHDVGDLRHRCARAAGALGVLLESPRFREHFSGDPGLRRVSLADNILVVDFDAALGTLSAGSWGELVLLQSIVHTALAAQPTADGVQVLLNGEAVASVGGHVYIGQPLQRDPTVVWGGAVDCHDHWAEVPVSLLTLRNALATNREGLFEPDRIITRAEFIESVHRAATPFEQMIPGSVDVYPLSFADMLDMEDADLAHIVRAMVAAGFLEPSHYGEPALLHPHEPITRREAAAVILSVADAGAARHLRSAGASVDCYARRAQQLGLIQGYEDASLRLHAPASRAEGAVLLARAIGLDPGPGGIAVALPQPGATLRPGEPIVGIAAQAGHTTLGYTLQMHECQTVVSEGQVSVYPDGWFSFAPRSTEGWIPGPAYLRVQQSDRIPVLLGK